METTKVRLRFLSHPSICGIILPNNLFQKLQLRHRQKNNDHAGKKGSRRNCTAG